MPDFSREIGGSKCALEADPAVPLGLKAGAVDELAG